MQRPIILALLLGTTAVPAVGQQRDCQYEQGPTGRAEQTQIGGELLIILHDPFSVNCADGTHLRANSGRINRTRGEHTLVGDVFFRDADNSLTADEATYTTGNARLWARGDVVLTDLAEGSTLRGPEIEYFRATDQRPEAQIVATQRPQLTLPARGPDDRPGEPIELVADRLTIVGEDDLSAFGSVVITRSDLHATGGEARFAQGTESFELRHDARVRSDGQELAGEVIQARMNEGLLEHVHARNDASLTGDDLRMTAPDIQLFLEEEVLERVVARTAVDEAGGRALAIARDFRIEADSIDAVFRDERIDNVVAIGSARGETIPAEANGAGDDEVAITEPLDDETAPDEQVARDDVVEAAEPEGVADRAPAITERDWIRGDTIIGYFQPVASAGDEADEDEAAEVELHRLIARGSAQSLYRLWNQPEGEAGRGRPNINFLVGEEIELDFTDGELAVANVVGLHRGIYLDAELGTPVPDEDTPAGPGPVSRR
jgi:lipopolysaccharide export system protein LptA